VFQALGFPIDSPKSLQVAKREVKGRVGELQSFGIDYDPKEEMFYYRGNEAIGFIPSLLNGDNKTINTVTVEEKKTTEDYIGQFIKIKKKESVIKNITYEMEGALIHSAYIETENGNNFNLKNTNHLDKSDFEAEVILHLEGLLYKV